MISALLKPTLVINGKKYKVMKQIGEGGFAFVYNVMSTGKDDNGERYALKKMICQTDEQLDEAKKEIDTMAKIMHENVLPLVDFSYTINKKGQKEALLLLPLYMGSVQTIIENGQGFPYCGFSDGLDVLKILRCCVEGLTAIHACGIRHADLKPANILLSENYHAVLTDFGSVSPFPVEVHSRTEALAIQDQAASYTTASYRAPELYNTPSSCVIGGESDVWSFGCLMFCMMFSRSPFESAVEGLSTLSIISAHYQIPEGCLWPQEYLDVISRCLQPDPALRATLAWVREQLQIIPCPPLQLMADIPPPVAAAKSITSPTLPPTALATHGPLKVAAAMQGLGSSTSTTSSAVSTGQIAFSASSASFTDDGGSFPHTPVSPTGSGVAALEVNFANFPAPVHFDAAAMQIQTAGSQDEFASSSSGLSDLFFGGGSAVNSIAGSYVIAEGFETMSTFTSGNNSPMHQHGSSGHHQLGRSGDQEGSEAKSSNVSFEGFEFMEAPGGGGCSPRAAINFRTEESAASVSSALSGFGGSGVGIAEGSSATSDVFTLEEDDEFGEFTASTQDTAAALDNCTVQEQESNFAHFPVTHGAVAKEEGENHPDKNNNAVIETVDLWKLITGQAMPTDAKAGQPRQQKHQVVKEGPVHMMRLGGFPKRWAKKQVWLVLTPLGVILRKDSSADSRIHEVLSLHRPTHLTPTDTLSVGLNGLLVQGSTPIPLRTISATHGSVGDTAGAAGAGAGAEDWVQISPGQHGSNISCGSKTTAFTAAESEREGSPASTSTPSPSLSPSTTGSHCIATSGGGGGGVGCGGPFRSLFSTAKFEISFESKEVMNDWMDAIMDCREALLL